MTVFASQMSQSATGNPEWIPCDGRWVSVRAIPKVSGTPLLPRPSTGKDRGYRGDYLRAVGGFSGRKGINWRVRIPYDPTGTWYIKLETDTADTAIPGAPTPQHPPPGVK
jgi:hypothetical protein